MLRPYADPVLPLFWAIKGRLDRPLGGRHFAKYAGKRKIIYALTPPPELSNIGDHAQVVAITQWIKAHFPELPMLEIDKTETLSFKRDILNCIRTDDIIFLHSGGNLGDRGMWSETGRRFYIKHFTENCIISMPQTIYFSNTSKGRRESATSQAIYNAHPNLTVIARDRISSEIASGLFYKARILTIPDFVLYMSDDFIEMSKSPHPDGVLLCLRNDSESIIPENLKESLASRLGNRVTVFDTTFSKPIKRDNRLSNLKSTLELFAKHKVIITDRFHGAIFGVLCRRPTVVLSTVDHKLSSSAEWFSNLEWIRFADDFDHAIREADKLANAVIHNTVDFKTMYFEPLGKQLRQKCLS